MRTGVVDHFKYLLIWSIKLGRGRLHTLVGGIELHVNQICYIGIIITIPSSPKRKKKISGTQGSCKSDIFKLKFDQFDQLCSARVYCPVYWGAPQINAPNFANK